MKKSVAAYWVFVASFVLVMSLYTADTKAQVLDRNLSLQNIASQLQSPEDIAHYMWRHFLFESDQNQFGENEHWQSPEEFMQTGKGDCEDFAIFANEILKLKGKKSFLLNVYGNRFAHTVCVFEENGKYNVIDGSRVIRFEAESLDKLTGKIYPFWKNAAIVKPSEKSNQGRVLSKFDRMLQAQHRLAVSA